MEVFSLKKSTPRKNAIRTFLFGVGILFLSAACSPVEFRTPSEAPPPSKPNCQVGDTRPECAVVIPPGDVDEIVTASARPKVDILVVMDNSESMFDEQQTMVSRFSGFTDSLNGLDWQLAITTTEVTRIGTTSPPTYRGGEFLPLQGSAGTILTRNTVNAQAVFESTIQMPTKSGVVPNDERGTAAANLALLPLEGGPAGSGLVRSDASLVILMVTDEDVRSDGGRTLGFEMESVDTVDSLLLTVRSQFGAAKADGLKVHSLIVRPGDNICLDRQTSTRDSFGRIIRAGDLASKADGAPGEVYRGLSQRTGGLVGSVCADRYTDELRQAWLTSGAQLSEISLRCVPRSSPALQVSFLDGVPAIPWTLQVNGNTAKVNLSQPAPAGTRVRLQYRCS